MITFEKELFNVAIKAMENVVNDVLYYEREEFLYDQREAYWC